jgi:hypothetical protein
MAANGCSGIVFSLAFFDFIFHFINLHFFFNLPSRLARFRLSTVGASRLVWWGDQSSARRATRHVIFREAARSRTARP